MPVGKHYKAKKHPAKLRKYNYPYLWLPRKAEFEGRALPDWLEDMLHHIAKLKINFKLVSNAAWYLTRLKEMLWFWIDSKQRFNGVGRAFSKNAHWPQVLETMTFWGSSEWLSLCFHGGCSQCQSQFVTLGILLWLSPTLCLAVDRPTHKSSNLSGISKLQPGRKFHFRDSGSKRYTVFKRRCLDIHDQFLF